MLLEVSSCVQHANGVNNPVTGPTGLVIEVKLSGLVIVFEKTRQIASGSHVTINIPCSLTRCSRRQPMAEDLIARSVL
ncbi:MAG: hypothetical protein DME68_06505 [Verrucomicrobia bacterium]|nr:MAG: hypothetical protein DME68_06505 [Verrucomicrobiota bacterium]